MNCPFLNFNVEIWVWISNFTPHVNGHVITYPCWDYQVKMSNSIMMLVKFLTSIKQKHRMWSCDESGLCNPQPRLLGNEVVVGPSLMFRKMDPWNVIRNILQDKTNTINCKKKWYSVGTMPFLIKLVFLSETLEFMNVWNSTTTIAYKSMYT